MPWHAIDPLSCFVYPLLNLLGISEGTNANESNFVIQTNGATVTEIKRDYQYLDTSEMGGKVG